MYAVHYAASNDYNPFSNICNIYMSSSICKKIPVQQLVSQLANERVHIAILPLYMCTWRGRDQDAAPVSEAAPAGIVGQGLPGITSGKSSAKQGGSEGAADKSCNTCY